MASSMPHLAHPIGFPATKKASTDRLPWSRALPLIAALSLLAWAGVAAVAWRALG